jgi:hypothetical protein
MVAQRDGFGRPNLLAPETRNDVRDSIGFERFAT